MEPVELFRFSSGDVPVSERERLMLELAVLVSESDEKALGHILRIVQEALTLQQVSRNREIPHDRLDLVSKIDIFL